MTTTKRVVLFTLLVLFSMLSVRLGRLQAKDKKLQPEEVVARHLESIGTPEARAAIKSRTAYGVTRVRRPIGTVPQILPEPGKQTDASNFLIASEEGKLGLILKFYDQEYPAEHFAYDGKDVTVGITTKNLRSILGEFILLHSGMMREGLLGGTLSTTWPLLNEKGGQFKLKYDLKEDNSVKLHQLTYSPKSRRYLDNIVIHLFFEYETFRHVMTEYVLMGLVNPTSFVLEKFGNYKNVDGLMLPHSYSIEYNTWRGISPTLWVTEIRQILHNGPIDPQLFHVQ
jgi:hypothetical protein